MKTMKNWLWVGGAMIALSASGCVVSKDAYLALEEKYQHALDTKTQMDREYVDLRQQVAVMEQSHGKLAGQVAALNETIEQKMTAKLAPLQAAVEQAKSETRKELLTVSQHHQDAIRQLAAQGEQGKARDRELEDVRARLDRLEEHQLKLADTLEAMKKPCPSEKKKPAARAKSAKPAKPATAESADAAVVPDGASKVAKPETGAPVASGAGSTPTPAGTATGGMTPTAAGTAAKGIPPAPVIGAPVGTSTPARPAPGSAPGSARPAPTGAASSSAP